jgi:hypothetical protein
LSQSLPLFVLVRETPAQTAANTSRKDSMSVHLEAG